MEGHTDFPAVKFCSGSGLKFFPFRNAKRLLTHIRLLFVLAWLLPLTISAATAGLEFTIPFAKKITSDHVTISNRLINTYWGPGDGQRLFTSLRLIPSGVSNQFLAIDWHTVLRVNGFTGAYNPEPTGGLDLNDWPMGLTYDSTANRAVLVTLGGEGFLFQRPANASAWSTLASMQNDDLDSIVYYPPQNSFWGLRTYNGAPDVPATLVRYSATGERTSDEINLGPLAANASPGWHKSQLIALDNKIILLLEPYPENPFGPEDRSRIYVIDPAARTMQLSWESHPRSATEIRVLSPAENANLNLGQPVDIRFLTVDLDNGVRLVELRDGSNILRTWLLDPLPGGAGTNVFEFPWTPTTSGVHSLSIRVTDADGAVYNHAFGVNVLSGSELVRLTTPTEGAQFLAGTNILLTAVGSERIDMASVWFRANGTVITNFRPTNHVLPQTLSTVWSNVPAGTHTLTFSAYVPFGLNTLYITSAPVRILVVTSLPPAIIAERHLPPNYIPAVPLPVSISVKPSAAVLAWAVEESVPNGWEVSEISHNGFFDASTRKIKWGPFTESAPVNLSYVAKALTTLTIQYTFTGTVSANGASNPITGDQTISPALMLHPADASLADWKLTLNEVTAYAAAWKSGQAWTRPPAEIPLSYVTRAGFLWRSGEAYRLDHNAFAPNCWVSSLSRTGALAALAIPLSTPFESSATRILAPAFTRGNDTRVTILVNPAASVQTYAVEEFFPAGWAVVDAGTGTVVRGGIRFGPYFDNQLRQLTYTLRPTANAIRGEFTGAVSFDGSFEAITGPSELLPPTLIAQPTIADAVRVHLRVSATPNETFLLESANTIDASAWDLVKTILGEENHIELAPLEPSDTQKFYRLRPLTSP
jgi:hypothetical protein